MANGLVPRRREVIAPGEAKYLRAVLLRNLRRAVTRARVDDNNLVHLALQTAKAAGQVGFFVLDDHAGGHQRPGAAGRPRGGPAGLVPASLLTHDGTACPNSSSRFCAFNLAASSSWLASTRWQILAASSGWPICMARRAPPSRMSPRSGMRSTASTAQR